MASFQCDLAERACAKRALLAAAHVQLEHLLARAVSAGHVSGEVLYKSIAVDAVARIVLDPGVGIRQVILSNPCLATVFGVTVFETADRGAQILKTPSADPALEFVDKPDPPQVVV